LYQRFDSINKDRFKEVLREMEKDESDFDVKFYAE